MEDIETDFEDTQSDGSGASSEPSSEESGEASAKAPAQETKPEPAIDWEQAFNHPRFKELVDQKNQALQQQRTSEQKYYQLEARLNALNQPQTQAQKDDLIEDLKKVDPRLADRLEKATGYESQIKELVKRLEGFEKKDSERVTQQTIQTAVSRINQMHESNKVSTEMKQFINAQLDLGYMQGKLNLQNLDQTYKETYDNFKKYEDAIKRAERESYVKAKKEDANVPASQPKGTPAKSAPKKQTWSKDSEVAKAQIVSRYLKQQAANKEADSV